MRSADEIAALVARIEEAIAGHPGFAYHLAAWRNALAWVCGATDTPFYSGESAAELEPEDGQYCEPFESLADDLGLIAPEPVEFCHIAVERGAEGGPIYAFVRSFGFDEASSLEATLAAGREAAGRAQIDGVDISVELEAIPVSKQLAAALDALGGTEWHKASWFRLDGVAELVPF